MWGEGLLLPPIFLSWLLFVPSMSAHWKMMTGVAHKRSSSDKNSYVHGLGKINQLAGVDCISGGL